MNNYDNMLAVNRERSREKITNAKIAIQELVEDGEQMSVSKLTKLTGLSRGFFYKNAEVRRELDNAMRQQTGTINRKRKGLRQATDGKVEHLQRQLAQITKENAELKKENAQLHEELNRQSLINGL